MKLSNLGLRAPFSRPALLATALVLALCVVLALAVNRLRQQATTGQTPPALTTTDNAPSGPVKKGAEAVVITSRMTPLRREPNEQAAVIMLVAEGQSFSVVDGPREAGGRNWWQINVGKETGWLPETLPDGTKVIAGK